MATKTTLYCSYCGVPLEDEDKKKNHLNVYPEHITSGFVNKEAGEDGKAEFIAATDHEVDAAKKRINAALANIRNRPISGKTPTGDIADEQLDQRLEQLSEIKESEKQKGGSRR